MKTKLYLLFFLGLAVLSCEEIPDLNPNTNAGADISVFEFGDTLAYAIEPLTLVINDFFYDLDDDGSDDVNIFFREVDGAPQLDDWGLSISVNGELLLKSQNNPPVIPLLAVLNSNNSFNAFNTYFEDANPNLINGTCIPFLGLPDCLEVITDAAIPIGNKFIMIKLNINGALHYGWINYYSDWSFDEESGWPNGVLILNSIGVANQPGVVLRAGQTD